MVVVGRWRKRGMKSSEGPESSTAKPKLPSERSAPAAPEPEWPPCPGARPGPARWGPLGLRPPGGGRGRPTWGAAQPRSPEIAEPGSATAAAKRRERTAETGGGWRLQSCCPGLGKSANYFQRTQTFLLPLLAAVPLALESFSGIPRGHWDAITSPGFLGGGSANFVDPGTRSARSAAEFSPRCSSAQQDRDPGRPCLREKRLAPIPWVRLSSPPHPLQNWSQRINLTAWLHGGASPGRGTTSLSGIGGLLDWSSATAAGRSPALSTLGRQPWGLKATRWPSFLV